MSYIPPPSISPKINKDGKLKRYTKPFIPRIKTVVIEPIVDDKRIALDNKFRASYLDRIFDIKKPNYSKQEVIDILERER